MISGPHVEVEHRLRGGSPVERVSSLSDDPGRFAE